MLLHRAPTETVPPNNPADPGFSLVAGAPGLDFINSVRFRGRAEECDTILEYAHLLDWTTEAGTLSVSTVHRLRERAEATPGAANATLRRARQLRDALFSAFSAVVSDERISGTDLGTLNGCLREAGRNRVVASDPGGGYSWRWDAGNNLEAPLWPIADSAGSILTSGQGVLVKQCDGESCLRIFLDSTKNRRRRWCDAAGCGNRHRVREHYRRSVGQA